VQEEAKGTEKEQCCINAGGGVMEDTFRAEQADPQADSDQGLAEEEVRPRVVDKRRFARALEGELAAEPVEEKPRYPSYVEELQTRLKISEERMLAIEQAYREAREKMHSEIEAIRTRLDRLMDERLEQSRAQFIGSFLDVLDNLTRALRSAEQTQSFQGLLEGVRVIISLFERRLENEGVRTIDPLNEPFDPRFHEAVDAVDVEPERDGIVVEVVERGYVLGEKTLIRPARVRVGRSALPASEEEAKEEVAPEPKSFS